MEMNLLDPTCHKIFICVRIPAWLPVKQTMHLKKICYELFNNIIFNSCISYDVNARGLITFSVIFQLLKIYTEQVAVGPYCVQ